MPFALSRLERLYAQIETTYGQVPNSGGTATVANANACRFIKFSIGNKANLIKRPDKTGTRTQVVGVLGRKSAAWSAEMSIAPNGVAGVAPDFDPFMQMLMGQAGGATAGTATITAASNASPIVVTAAAHGYANGDAVFISGVLGNTAANGPWFIASVTTNTFALVGSTGNAAYTSGGTASRVGYKYSLSDSIPSASLWSFRQPSTIDQRVIMGSVVQETSFQLGQDVAQMNMSGEGLWGLGSNQFGVADSSQKAGLSTFPTEPGAPVTNGGIIAGFTGKIAVNANNIATIRSATIRNVTSNVTVKDTFGTYYPTSAEGDERAVSISFSLYEDDTTAYQNLVQIAHDKTAVSIPMFLGTLSGSIFGVMLNNVQIEAPAFEEQRRFIANFPESMAHGSSLTAKDEMIVVLL